MPASNQLTFPTNIDSTMLSTYSACPQKFFQEFIIRKVPIGKSIHLHAGGCVAGAFEDIRNYYYRDKLPLNECFEKAFPDFVKRWGMYDALDGTYKDFVNCWMVVEAYFKEYPPDTDYFQPLMRADGAPAVEFKFAIPTRVLHPETASPVLYSGRVDMLAESKDNPGAIYTVDEKTTKALGLQWQYQWDMRGQFYGYTYAARYMGYNCAGTLVRGMAIQQTKFAFQEKPLFFSEYQLNRWWAETNRKIAMMALEFQAAKAWYEDNQVNRAHDCYGRAFGDACSSYGGCQFVDLCRAEYPQDIYRDWEERVWNPLEKDPTAGSEDRMSQMGQQSLADLMEGML